MDRREFIEAAAAGAAGLLMPGTALAWGSSKPMRGTVTAEGSGKMAGVTVSDGLNCVRTDANGAFELPPREGARFVTVTPPSGFWPVPSYNPVPRKYWPYDFHLRKLAPSAGRGCRFVHIADSEIWGSGPNEMAWTKRVKDIADEVQAAFIVHTGDICRDPGLRAHIGLMNAETMGRPVVYCIGNHDLEAGPYGENEFETLYGPVWHSFEAGGAHFCVTPMPYGDFKPSYTTDDVADWLKNDLALVPKGMPVVLFGHMLSNADGPDVDDVGFTFGKERKIDLRKLCNLTGFVYGHVHRNRFLRFGKTAFVCTGNPEKGGIDLTPESVRIVSVSGNGRLESEVRYGHAGLGHWTCERAGAEWEADVGAPVMFGEPVVSDGLVLVGTADEDGRGTGGVVALNAMSGKVVWRRGLPASVRGRMALLGGTLVVQDTDGGVYAFRAKDGVPQWKRAAKPHPFEPVANGLAVDRANGVVFAGYDKSFSALDVKSGRVLWRNAGWPGHEAVANSDAPGYGEGVVVFAGNWNGLFAHDAKTGRLLWHREGAPFNHPGATPLVKDGTVRSLGTRSFYELDLATGKTLREVDVGSNLQVTTRVLETDRLFLFGSSGKGLIALDKKMLKVVWTADSGPSLTTFAAYAHPPETSVGTVPLLFDASTVVASTADGAVHFWNLADGRSVREIRTGAPYLAGVTLSGKKVFAADLAGKVRKFG